MPQFYINVLMVQLLLNYANDATFYINVLMVQLLLNYANDATFYICSNSTITVKLC